MPGGRLTEQERRQIAQWLHDDLPYAEIGRRLGRPTSTVTREVLRNGGPVAYRADLAQYATQRRRTRKRAPAAPGRVARVRGPEAVHDYQERLAATFVQAGLPRLASRVLACLYTCDADGLTAAELGARLQVSPASVSKAIALLEGLSQIRRDRAGRRHRYLVDDDVLYQSAMASARATAALGALARDGVAVVGAGSAAGARLSRTADGAELVAARIAEAAEQTRALLRALPGPGCATEPDAAP